MYNKNKNLSGAFEQILTYYSSFILKVELSTSGFPSQLDIKAAGGPGLGEGWEQRLNRFHPLKRRIMYELSLSSDLRVNRILI